ncbi:SGNH/GDSL hydrolase family protein [Kribbella deserti]|uniref:SGNH/GDSL hydrolase family protein n=1 Tax=Kribbella deserti TaxID=1926257 RepID=A0ABV6QVX1_9ACTN
MIRNELDPGCGWMDGAPDPYCLRPGQAAELVAGHPWHRFVVLGDSVASGPTEPVAGYNPEHWTTQVANALGVEFLNLGVSGLRAREVRESQLEPAVHFRPDLALVVCGGNDAFSSRYDPEAVDAELRAMILRLQRAGAEVITIGMFDVSHSPAVPDHFRAGLGERMRTLSAHTATLAHELGTLHVDLTSHPASKDPTIYSTDGKHGNARSDAIATTQTLHRLTTHLHP